MSSIHLKIITPKKIVMEEEIHGITVPTVEGEITVLPRHMHLFALLKEGIVHIKAESKQEDMAIGGGYIETDGKEVKLLVSRAYGQDAIDENMTKKAIEDAQRVLKDNKDQTARHEAESLLRRSAIDMKLIKRRKRHQ